MYNISFCSEEDDEDIFTASPSPFSATPPVVVIRQRGDGGRGSLIPQPVDNPPPPPPRHGSATITPPIHLSRVPLPHIPPPQREQPGPPAVQQRQMRPLSTSGGSAPVWPNSGQFGPGKQEKDVRNMTQIKKVITSLCFSFCSILVVQICS